MSDEQDEGEVYRLYKSQRYINGPAAVAVQPAAEEATVAEMQNVLCKSACGLYMYPSEIHCATACLLWISACAALDLSLDVQ